jgi:hypothetical protein
LGPFQVAATGRVVEISSAKQRSILAILAVLAVGVERRDDRPAKPPADGVEEVVTSPLTGHRRFLHAGLRRRRSGGHEEDGRFSAIVGSLVEQVLEALVGRH